MSVAASHDGQMLASASWDQTVRIWNVATGRQMGKFEGHEGRVHSVAFSPDGRTVVSTCEDRITRFWDVATGKAVKKIEEEPLK